MKQTLTKASLNTLIAGAFTATMALSSSALAEDMEKTAAETEKCYGVAKAGKNDCGDSKGTHSCAAQSMIDGDGTEWLSLPKGICERLAGGSLEPYEGTEPPADTEEAEESTEEEG